MATVVGQDQPTYPGSSFGSKLCMTAICYSWFKLLLLLSNAQKRIFLFIKTFVVLDVLKQANSYSRKLQPLGKHWSWTNWRRSRIFQRGTKERIYWLQVWNRAGNMTHDSSRTNIGCSDPNSLTKFAWIFVAHDVIPHASPRVSGPDLHKKILFDETISY